MVSGLEGLEFRDQLLVFLDGALGARRGELGGLPWVNCDFQTQNVQRTTLVLLARRGGHLKVTKTEGSAKLLPMHAAMKDALLEWKSLSLYTQAGDFVFPSHRCKGRKPLDLAAVLEAEDPAGVRQGRHHWRGLAYISAHGGNDAGRDGGAPAHHPRLPASQQSSRHQQISAGDVQQQAAGARQIGRRHTAAWSTAGQETNPGPVRFGTRLNRAGEVRGPLIILYPLGAISLSA